MNMETMHHSDEDLMRRTQEGDLDAFASLYERYRKPLAKFIYRFVGNYDDAGDVLHDVVLKVYERRRQYRHPEKTSSWLFRIARNQCLDFLRAAKREAVRSAEDIAPARGESALLERFAARQGAPEDDAVQAETGVAVSKALGALPLQLREALVMRVVQGMTFDEIAGELEVSSRTVRNRVAEALRLLRRALEGR